MKAVQEILGHANFSTTADVYAHVLPAMQKEAAARMDSVLNPAAEAVPNPVASNLASTSVAVKLN